MAVNCGWPAIVVTARTECHCSVKLKKMGGQKSAGLLYDECMGL